MGRKERRSLRLPKSRQVNSLNSGDIIRCRKSSTFVPEKESALAHQPHGSPISCMRDASNPRLAVVRSNALTLRSTIKGPDGRTRCHRIR